MNIPRIADMHVEQFKLSHKIWEIVRLIGQCSINTPYIPSLLKIDKLMTTSSLLEEITKEVFPHGIPSREYIENMSSEEQTIVQQKIEILYSIYQEKVLIELRKYEARTINLMEQLSQISQKESLSKQSKRKLTTQDHIQETPKANDTLQKSRRHVNTTTKSDAKRVKTATIAKAVHASQKANGSEQNSDLYITFKTDKSASVTRNRPRSITSKDQRRAIDSACYNIHDMEQLIDQAKKELDQLRSNSSRHQRPKVTAKPKTSTRKISIH